jgi:hypothetical protein
LLAAVVVAGAPPAASAEPPSPGVAPPANAPEPAAETATTDPAKRDELLGSGWQESADRMWTTSGDATGFHILVAEAKTGYAWRTAATLNQPGVEADQWIGNACVTGSGRRAVVVYAPRTFTNRPVLFDRGGFTAVVDLVTGVVTRLAVRTSLAYFNPGCGTGETAVLTQGGEGLDKTRVIAVDAAKQKLGKRIEVPGQLTSALPVGKEIVAADADAVVRVRADGSRVVLSESQGVPSHLRPDSAGGVVFMDRSDADARVRRVERTDKSLSVTGSAAVLAQGPAQQIDVAASANGQIFITGSPAKVNALPPTVRRLATPVDTEISTRGEIAVTRIRAADPSGPGAEMAGSEAPQPINIDAQSVRTGKKMRFGVDPGDSIAPRADDTVDTAHTCAVARNDPRIQVYQPKPKQVEWAVNMAVKGQLTITRPAGWKKNGQSSSYTPQGLFPPQALNTGGQVPAQIMLGILGQESNLWQASRNIVPGQTGNPLIGNYYGTAIYDADDANDWDIRFDHADCGYGVTQMTDGMRKAGHERPNEIALSPLRQTAIATDYAANVAAGLQLLQGKWNQMQYLGMQANDNDPSKIENWYFAVWAYNAGWHGPGEPDTNGAYGLGWAQNGTNPNYDPARHMFGSDPHDFSEPQKWPYPEKVIGFAANPPSVLESPDTYVPMFRPAWWNTNAFRSGAPAPPSTFCTAANNCEWGAKYTPTYPGNGNAGTDVRGEPAGPCAHKSTTGQYDLKCWWHSPASWKDNCPRSCGNEFIRYDYPAYAAEPEDGLSYAPKCTTTPIAEVSGLLVVDDIATSIPNVSSPSGCARPANAGSFDLTYATDSAGRQASKIDLHQVGGGFGGHMWWGHSRNSDPSLSNSDPSVSKLKLTGTWSFSAAQSGWGRLMVHLPDHHAHTQQAEYKIDTGTGSFTKSRFVNQKRRANNWVSLGVYNFTGKPRVQLSTQTKDGIGEDDVAFDAVGFQKLSAKPKHFVAVLGDSYTSGEGAGNYFKESDIGHGTWGWNACRRSKDAWGRKLTLPGTTASIGAKADSWAQDVELGFVACSGARTYNVANGDREQKFREGQFGEENQVDSGVLSSDTTLVMLTVGGNDRAAFSTAMQECGPPTNCALDETFLPRYKAFADEMAGNVTTLLYQITSRAPNAQIVLMGYPELLSRTVKCTGSWWYDGTEVAALAELVNYGNSKQKEKVDQLKAGGMKIAYADPVATFVGHSGCDSPEWINKFVSGPIGEGDYHDGDPAGEIPCQLSWLPGWGCLSRAAFHPNNTGTTGYASVMRAKLDELGYQGKP